MAGWIRQQLLQRKLLLLLLAVSQQQQPQVIAATSDGAVPKTPRGLPPHTMTTHEGPLPVLQTKTLFVVDNEPVVESHIVSNLLHQLLFTVGVPQSHILMRDEAFLLGSKDTRLSVASLGRWLAAQAEALPKHIEFVFICSAYTRISPKTLEALLKELKTGAGPFMLGWGLVDEKPTIIHHFAPAKSQMYPDLDAGMLLSREAFVAIKKAVTETPPAAGVEKDMVYELYVHLKKTQNLQLLHSELFCPSPPVIEGYDRAHTAYPANHTRPKSPPGAQASAAANKRELSPGEAAAAKAAETVAAVHKGCVSFSSGTRHAPVLSHQMFDALIDFDEELLIKREKLGDNYSIDEMDIEGGPYQKALEALERSRPGFIVDPQDMMVAVKTCAANHDTRVPLLRKLWASPEALLSQAERRGAERSHADDYLNKQEHKQLKETYDALSLRFFSDTPDPKLGIEAPKIQGAPKGQEQGPKGKGGLCLRLQQIFREFLATPETRRFLLVTDDDTLLNFRHVMDLLSLTLQPVIPARGFVANMLADNHGFRAYSPEYKLLAEQIRSHLKGLAAAADAAGGHHEGLQQQQPKGDSRYTAAQLTEASSVYGRGAHRPLEAVSPLYLGERYAFGLTGGSGRQGYDYVTMGGGVLLDREAVQLLVQCINSGKCTCPEDGTADDMMLGMWARNLDIPLVNARGMHQEKPGDYHPLLIESTTPVSFHRIQQSIKETKRIFTEFVDVAENAGNVSGGSLKNVDDLIEVDWIDHDWHHAEQHLWMEREELYELDEDEPSLVKTVGDVLNSKVTRGIRPMTPEELLAHDDLDEGAPLHDEL